MTRTEPSNRSRPNGCLSPVNRSTDRGGLLCLAGGVFLLLLMAVTYPLWLSTGSTPLVPLVDVGLRGSIRRRGLCRSRWRWVWWGSLSLRSRCRGAWWLVAASLWISFLIDQHRLQPWAYQSALYALLFAAMRPARARRWMIPLAASVYLYSAAVTWITSCAHRWPGIPLRRWKGRLGGWGTSTIGRCGSNSPCSFPAAEFTAGMGLLFRVTRRWAAAAIMLMHLCLMMILGPWVLDHSTGVLVWNLLLLVASLLIDVSSSIAGSDRRERE